MGGRLAGGKAARVLALSSLQRSKKLDKAGSLSVRQKKGREAPFLSMALAKLSSARLHLALTCPSPRRCRSAARVLGLMLRGL
jgi:hypothetical protein